MARTSQSRAQTDNPAQPECPGAGAPNFDVSVTRHLHLRIELQSMQTLHTVLANVARLGCVCSEVAASNNRVDLGLRAPAQIAHRVRTCLAQIIGVQNVSSRTAAASEVLG